MMTIFSWAKTKLPPLWSFLSMAFAPLSNMIGLFPEQYRGYFSDNALGPQIVNGVIVGGDNPVPG